MNSIADSIFGLLESDVGINLSTEMVGVALSIPLSVWIAGSLDRRADKRRMRRSLQAVTAESRHELEYLTERFPNELKDMMERSVPTDRLSQQIVYAADLMSVPVDQSIATARAVFGDRLDSEFKVTLQKLAYNWRKLVSILSYQDPDVLNAVTNGESRETLSALFYERIMWRVRWVNTRTADLEKISGQKQQDQYSNEIEGVRLVSEILADGATSVLQTSFLRGKRDY